MVIGVNYRIVGLCQELIQNNAQGYFIINDPIIILIFLVSATACVIFMFIGWYIGNTWTLKYVWTNGISHTQKEYSYLYRKWKNKID